MLGFTTLAGVALLSAPSVWAASSSSTTQASQAKGSLVSLGDSITFGYNLSDTNHNTVPSKSAYPFLLGKQDDLSVTDLGVPGWRSSDLLAALHNPNFSRPISSASVVTVNIGNNDLLGLAGQLGLLSQAGSSAAPALTPQEQQAFAGAIKQFSTNFAEILGGLRKMTSAPIVVYNLYDPFPSGTGLHTVTEQFESAENQLIAKESAGFKNVSVVDAHQAFEGHQTSFVRVAEKDVHPTVQGQVVLATIGQQAIAPDLAKMTSKSTNVSSTTALVAGEAGAQGGVINGTVNGSSVQMKVPTGALPTGGEIDITGVSANSLSKMAPKGMKVVAEAGVNLMYGMAVNVPLQLTVSNSAIPANGAVYEVVNGKLTLVSGATVTKGKAVIPTSAGGDFVVLAPVAATVTQATKPVTGLPFRSEGMWALALVVLGAAFVWLGRRRRTEG